MYYIQRKSPEGLETVDEFETMKEARAMVIEYNMCDPTAHHYISTRCCKAWRDR